MPKTNTFISIIFTLLFAQTLIAQLDSNDVDSLAADLQEIYVLDSSAASPVSAGINLQLAPDDYKRIFAPNTFVEVLSIANGLQNNIACGVCGTNSININGIGGAYTAIAIDGVPLYGSLASVYGLNSIPSAIIQNVEIERGAASVYYGTEAIGGVINVQTKTPDGCGLLKTDVQLSNLKDIFLNGAYDYKLNNINLLTAAHFASSRNYIDRNRDNFGDNVQFERFNLMQKLAFGENSQNMFMVKYYHENRRNGVYDYLKNGYFRQNYGSNTTYGEYIRTHRAENTARIYLGDKNRFIQQGASLHFQNSYYGDVQYKAVQSIFFINGLQKWQVANHFITFLLNARYEFYDDNSSATATLEGENKPVHNLTPAIMLEDNWQISPKTQLTVGARLDIAQNSQPVFTPRCLFVHNFSSRWRFTSNLGTGFRLVNLFTEDHAFITGRRQVFIGDNLRPERSVSTNISLSYTKNKPKNTSFVQINAFFTHFWNAIIADYSQPNAIIYDNINGYSRTRGLNFVYNQMFKNGLSWELNGSLNWANRYEFDNNNQLTISDIEFSTRANANAVVSYNVRKYGLTFAYTAKWIGQTFMPAVFDVDANGDLQPNPRPLRAPAFALHNLQVSKTWPKHNLETYIGASNLFNYLPPISPLAGYNDPNAPVGFSPYFDTAYNFAPLQGRRVYLGVRAYFHPTKPK